MTLEEVAQALEVSGVTVWYNHAPTGTKVPFITYTCASDNFFADDKVYNKKLSLRAVLYSSKKDTELETRIEQALTDAGLPWNMTDSFENEQKVFMTIYESEVI